MIRSLTGAGFRMFTRGSGKRYLQTTPRKTTMLKNLLSSPNLDFIMEAHDGLSSKIVEEAGFKGIWGSGLSISASMGVRDSNEATYTQVVEVLEFMSDATKIPILLDGDTGYGNFNNARRLVSKLESRGIAGVCLEDKLFPKSNSLLSDSLQPLADIEEFCLKIKACKDTQKDPDFQVVARVEAFIAGWDVNEALKRAEAYRNAGVDAILIHSKQDDGAEITSFLDAWEARHPIVLVPTNYYQIPTSHWREKGVNLIIWANHNLRASIAAQQAISKQVFAEQCLNNAEERICSVKEVFRLQNQHELTAAEKRYLPNVTRRA
uniref:phosphoenolpyruvate mutase n=1 Tax=Spongospora subterranea TaxID=70186 RepID=A0A0H5R5E5_9EUKA|eukprot:CRZ09385.1 hypothetical protein [Spongospora subterranea]